MNSLIMSRIKKDPTPTKLQNLSPQKYGKAAMADLTYTPSKLADNVMYRDAATLRKNQGNSNKLRELQAMNGYLKQRLGQLQIQRDGIQKSLNQQIGMYKKMLHQSEAKNQARLKEIQKRFSDQIALLIDQKQQQAKFAQAQQEILQDQIQKLQEQLKYALDRQNNIHNQHENLRNYKQKLEIECQKLKNLLDKITKEKAADDEQWKKKWQEQRKKWAQIEKAYQDQLQSLINQKANEKDAMERLLRTELQKAQNTRMSEGLRKSQELRDVMAAFESQTKRLNEIIAMKERMLQTTHLQNVANKQGILQLTKDYQQELNNMVHINNQLNEQVGKQQNMIAQLKSQLQIQIKTRDEDRNNLGKCIKELQDELQRNQVNYIRECDRFEYWGSDLQRENTKLKKQNERIADIIDENSQIKSELRNLRDLLVESSYQIQKSKDQLLNIARQRDNLKVIADKVMGDNDRLYKTKRDLEEETLKRRFVMYPPRQGYY